MGLFSIWHWIIVPLFVLWILVPFAVFGIKPLLRELVYHLQAIEKQNDQLIVELRTSRQTPQSVADQPVADKPVADEPVADEPVVPVVIDYSRRPVSSNRFID